MSRRQVSGRIPLKMEHPDFEVHHYKTPFESVGIHFHDFYEVYLLLSDSVTFTIGGRQYRLKQHDILLLSPHELHHPLGTDSDDARYERMDVYIRPEFIASHSAVGADLRTCFERCQTLPSGNLLRPSLRLLHRILSVMHALQEQRDSGGFGSALLSQALIVELLVYLNQASIENNDHGAQDVYSNEVVDRMIQFINENLCESITLDLLSDRFFMSKYHLVRIFKRHTCLTPHQFVRYKRLLTARQLLREGMSVTDVCQACGFSDYTNFIRAFREEFGVSPGRYASSEGWTSLGSKTV